jgi:2-octaprenyl-6-methoxyphenol hydroxylase
MRKKTDSDVTIIGAGMAGLTLGARLAQSGMDVAIIDREDPGAMATDAFDSRTVALSAGTRNILEPLDIWNDMVPAAEAITSIDVQEGHDPFILNFNTADAQAPAFGWILPNSLVRRTLYDACRRHGVTFITGQTLEDIHTTDEDATAILSGGTAHHTRLLIGADGKNSRVRAILGIDVVNLDYKHVACVGLIAHEHPHNGLALERFYPSGPFAVLPFTDKDGQHRSAIVWSRHARDVKHTPVDLKDVQAVTEAIAPMLDERYGETKALGKWAAFPLTLHHAKSMIGQRVALISDAAHAIHPIAGQGLNLGMRDIDLLATELPQAKSEGRDWGSDELLAAYQRARRFDVFTMVAATDLLTRLFGNRLPGLGRVRSLGLGIVEKLPPLKRFFMAKAMGE